MSYNKGLISRFNAKPLQNNASMMAPDELFQRSEKKQSKELSFKNIEKRIFWDGLAKRNDIGENDTRFIGILLPNNIWVYEWFLGSAITDTIYDFVDYFMEEIYSNKEKPEPIPNYTIRGYTDELKVTRGKIIKDDMKRSSDLRKREQLKVVLE